MQSDLDILSTKFDNHINNLSKIHSAGLMHTHNYSIVVSRPGLSASKEDMKFYMKDLLSRLKIGDTHMKKEALFALDEAIHADKKYVKILLEINCFISLMVNFLGSRDIEIQEEATKVVSVIAGVESYRGVLLGGGIISPLIKVLESGSGVGKEFSMRSLMKFTENSDNAWSVSAHGGVTVLVKICSNCDSGGELVSLACALLKNLVGVEEIRRFMVEEGSIGVFIKLVRSKDEVSQISSIKFLQVIGSVDESIRHLIIQQGGVRVLVRVLDPKSSFSSKSREVALEGIVNLCPKSVFSLHVLINCGFMDHIQYFLRYGVVSDQEMGLKAACWLCGTSEEAKRAMGDAGFMTELVKFLDAKSSQIRDMAVEILSGLVLFPRNRKRFVQNDQSVGMIMGLLNSAEANSGNRKLLLSIVMSLTSCNSGRKKIVNSGYLKNIEKLADSEDSDAKKIVKKLSTKRFFNIFSGIWHS